MSAQWGASTSSLLSSHLVLQELPQFSVQPSQHTDTALNLTDGEPSTLKTCPPPFPSSTCKWVKVAHMVHQGFLPTSREGGHDSEGKPLLARQAEELEGSGAGAGSRNSGR